MSATDIASSLPDTDDLFKKADPRAAYMARAKSDQEKLNKAATDATTGLEGDIAARDKLTEEAKKPGGALAPFEPTPYKPPAPTDPWSNWGSPAMWFAGLSGVIGRRSATRALDAGAAYLNAVNAKDQKLAQQKFDEYKVENENAIKAHEWTRDAYKDALEGVKANSADRKAIYETVAHAINDDVMLQALDKGVDHADKLSEERQRHADEMALHQGEVVKAKALSDYSQAQKDFVAAKAKGDQQAMDEAVARGHAAEQVLTVGQYRAEGTEKNARVLQYTDDYRKADDEFNAAKEAGDQKAMAVAAAKKKQAQESIALLDGKMAPMGADGKSPSLAQEKASIARDLSSDDPETVAKAKERMKNLQEVTDATRASPRSPIAALMEKWDRSHPDATDDERTAHYAEIGSISKAYKDWATGKQGDQVRAFSTAVSHMEVLSEAKNAMDSGDIPAFNAIALRVATELGKSAAPKTYDALKQIVADEIFKGVVPGAGTGTERALLNSQFAAADSPAQYRSAMEGMTSLMGGQLTELERQYKRTTKLSDGFDGADFLSDAAKDVYRKYKAEEAQRHDKKSNASKDGWSVERVQ